jgi:hypothetical protein
MWTGTESVRVMCIRFPLDGEHRFKLPRLLDISNRLSCGHQHIAKIWNVGKWWINEIALS